VLGRVVQLEMSQGPAFRAQAAKPLVRRRSVPGVRGRILARNGTVLACDKEILGLAVHYRWLEEPPDPQWLRWTARSRLSKKERKDPERVAAEEDRVRIERAELAARLARLSGSSAQQWRARAAQIQARVEHIADCVNRYRAESRPPEKETGGGARPAASSPEPLLTRLGSSVAEALRRWMDEPPRQPITVAEELDDHVMVEDVPLALVAEIEEHPERYPCVRVVHRSRRAYRCGRLAAPVLGHLGDVAEDELSGTAQDAYHPDDRVGRMGLERQYEPLLRARRGVAVELTDRSGRVVSSYRQREPEIGRDLVLTLDPELQRAAEDLLASALERRAILDADSDPAGGAIAVIDVHSGEILAAASAPGFDPNLFSSGREGEVESLLSDPAHPLFDRVAKMAIPPGSVFKIVAAAALLEEAAVDPAEAFLCQGYLREPDRRRCAIYTRYGIGHGEVTLTDALAESCNVYFFHHAGQLDPNTLVGWATRFGFGRRTGVDLPGEASGTLPTPATIRKLEGHAWRTADTETVAIGQGSLEVTPLQVVRMMAAIANGGLLVTPHVVRGLGLPELPDDQSTADLSQLADDPIQVPPPRPIPGLKPSTLATIRQGLERVVADPAGTAHGTVYVESIPIAGKTGTAETGAGRATHAWFAGYAPADRPKLAFVVVLEHAGDAAQTAGPVANRLVRQMQQLGYFDRRATVAARQR
jgi:penicillin-binding protein 2